MSMARCVIRLLMMYALAIAQIVFAYSHAGLAAPAISDQTVVICTPTGLQKIAWPIGQEDPPADAPDPFCPLCVVGAAVAPPVPSLAGCGSAFQTAVYSIPAKPSPAPSDGAPYPARAPPA